MMNSKGPSPKDLVNFRFDGKKYTGHKGEPLSAALLRAGVVSFTESINFHRPRGIMGLGVEETNGIVQFESGARESMIPATMIELVEGLSVRSLAGIGDLPDLPETGRYDRIYRHTDVLVVGAGLAGLTAARKLLLEGREVMLVDDQPGPGGHYRHLDRNLPANIQDILKDILNHKNLTYLARTTVFGLYDQGMAMAVERRTDHLSAEILPHLARLRTWHIRADHIVLAPGAFQRPLVFANNDRPGILLSHAAATYVDLYNVRTFKRAVVVTVDNQGYRDALRLQGAGVQVEAILDSREKAEGPSVAEVLSRGILVKFNCTVIDTETDSNSDSDSEGALKVVTAMNLFSKETLKIEADLLAVSGGWTPTVHLATFLGIKPTWSESHAAFLVRHHSSYLSTAGMLAGEFGHQDSPATYFGAHLDLNEEKARWAFIDFQRDSTLHGLRRAVGAGLESIEHIKRYTSIGTAHDQGKTSGTTTMGLMSQLIKGGPRPSPDEIGTLSFRPPYIPVPFVALAGRDRGVLTDPVRTTPIHSWHLQAGAPMEDVGQWKRPWYFPRSGAGENMRTAVLRECTAARKGVAIMDASTLGKIDIQGPDAAQFLDRIYTNVFSSLKVGHCRYGLMCRTDGMVFDDGVTTRLGENHFLMTTTTGGAAGVLAWLEEWLQTEWPELKVYCTSVTEQISTIALVGPKSRELMSLLAPDLDVRKEGGLAFMESRETEVTGIPARVARISFSGELAYEINISAWFGRHVWEQIMKRGQPLGITPYGTETMHVLRAEKGFVIVGQETDGTQTPADLDMEWIVSKKKDFLGKRSFLRADTRRIDRHQLVGLWPEEGSEVIPEGAYIKLSENPRHIGYVTSSYESAELGHSFALALVADGLKRMGEQVIIPLGDKIMRAKICNSVFIDKENTRRDG